MTDNGTQVHDRVSVNNARFIRPRQAPNGELRDFEADIEATIETGGENSVIGRIRGCLTWSAWLPDLTDRSRSIHFPEIVAATIEICDLFTEQESRIDAALIIEHVWLVPEWRGSRLSRRILEQLIDLLLLTPENTLVIACLEPPPNPTNTLTYALDHHNDTDNKLNDAYRQAGFQQWDRTSAWWLRPNSASWQP